ncbi:MAG TPA: hypothetical protein VFU17_11335, partial [Candidatus Limnocylindrales bacterium]|nr:hypothetical protein [Candidatus Limnocylindrales bacterium]
MTASDRLDQRATELLVELAAPAYPDYFDHVLERAIDRRQRPAWTFPERWLPMGVIARRVAPAPAMPWRTIGLLALLGVLLATALVAGLAAWQQRPAPPYGLASNGDVAYGYNGDIHFGDPANPDASRAVITGPEDDLGPIFSRDGSYLAFVRNTNPGFAMLVADADGRGAETLISGADIWDPAWSPDSKALAAMVEIDGTQRLAIVPIDGSATQFVSLDVQPLGMLNWLPPNGERLFFIGKGDTVSSYGLYSVAADGTDLQQHGELGHQEKYMTLAMSPAADRVLFMSRPVGGTVQIRSLDLRSGEDALFGAAMPPPAADIGVGPLHAGAPRISPDGSRIVFGRYWDERDGQINHQVWTASLASDGADAVPVGEVHRSRSGHGPFDYTFSPDGASILVQFNEVPVTWLAS